MKCFQCFRRSLLICPKEPELNLSVGPIHRTHFDIEELRSQWHKLVLPREQVRVTLDVKDAWSHNDLLWTQLCDFFQTIAHNVCSFSTTLSGEVEDEKWATMFQQLPPNLQELSITTAMETPLAYRRIGQSLINLKRLVVCHADGCPLSLPRKKLPGLIQSLPNLERLTLWNLPEVSYEISWKELLCAIQSREHLIEANVYQGYTLQGHRRATNPMTDIELEGIQFRPRLIEAMKHICGGNKIPTSLNDFVRAVVMVQDRVDCLDYLFSTVDPNLYAPTAIANLTRQRGQSNDAAAAARSEK